MRILQVTHYMPPHSGGIERVAAALVAGLRARGHDVHWIASATPLAPSAGPGESRVKACNVLEERGGIPFPIWGPRSFAAVREKVAWADVVHAHDCLYMGTSAAARACGRLRRPLLLTQHVGYVPYGAVLDVVQRMAYRTLGARNLAAATALVACSPHVAQYFSALGVKRPFHVIPNAVGVERFHPDPKRRAHARATLGLPEGTKIVLFVGRLVAKKAVPRVLAVQRELARDRTTLLVVGDGPLRPLLASAPATVHVPQVAPERMSDVYAAADVFLLPSRGEGLPVSVQEALLSGVPSVVSDDPAFTSNLSDAPGVVIARTDAELLAATRRLLAEPPAADLVAEWARARWTTERFLLGYEALLRTLAAAAHGAAAQVG